MRHTTRHECRAAYGTSDHLAIKPEADLTFKNEEELLMPCVDMQRRAATRRFRRFECEVKVTSPCGSGHSQSGITPRIQRISDVKDDEFEGDEQVQKAMKGMLPPLLDGLPS